MPSSSQPSGRGTASQPADRQPPKPVNRVLAEAEQQWLFTEEELLQAPSIVDGMKPEQERELRNKGVNFILQAGAMLKLPTLTLSAAAVFLHRFLMRRSLVSKEGRKALHHYQIAATSLFLATKVEENVRKLKDIVIACCRVAQKNPNLEVDEQSKDYWRWRDTLVYNEDVLLEAICFDLTVEAPHKAFFEMLKYYRMEHNKRLRNNGWAFINDSQFTQLCLLQSSRTIAASALYCGARLCDVSFPDERGKPWWDIQGVRLRDVIRACNYMTKMFQNVTPKDGAENIYVGLWTPEDSDPRFDKTRLRNGSQTPQSPAYSVAMERSSSEQSLKRRRDDEGAEYRGPTSNNADSRGGSKDEKEDDVNAEDADRVSKRPRVGEANGLPSRPRESGNGPTNGGMRADDQEGSEEGEVSE